MNSNFFYFNVYFYLLLFVVLVSPCSAFAQTGQGEQHDVPINEIVEITLPDNAAAVLLGNPDIADILSQSRSSVVIGGKRIGRTNLLVTDRDQNVIRNIAIAVNTAGIRNITIFRGVERADFACSQACELKRSYDQQSPQTPSPPKSADPKP